MSAERRPDCSIARWVDAVPSRQWQREDRELAATGEAIPARIVESRALAEVHRLDLALFVVFEEAALRVSGVLTRRAPDLDALHFAAQQTLDEARHHELFRRRLAQSRGAASDGAGGSLKGTPESACDAVMIPPLRRFIDHCYEVADRGDFVEGLALMNLVLEGMAYPLYAYEELYWRPVDPYLAQLIESAHADETRHVAFGAQLVRRVLDDDPAARARAARLCAEARAALGEVFRYYVRRFVGMFDAVARRHASLFGGAEFAPGRRIADTPYEEQVAAIHHRIDVEHGRLLGRAGLA